MPSAAAGKRGSRYFIDRNFARLRGGYERRLHGSLNNLPVTLVFAVIVLGSIYFLFTGAKTELAPQEDQGVIITQSIAAPELDPAAAAALFAAGLQDLRRPSGDRARLSARRARPVDRRHGVQAVGPARQDHQRAAAGAAAGAEQGRRRARRRVPAAGAAGQLRPAGSVRYRHHRSVRAPERRCAAISAAGAGERHVHLSRLRSENRQSAIRHHHRSRQDRAARPEDERRRRLARRHARRRLCQLFQHQRPLLQGDPAGAAALSAQRRSNCSTITSAPPTDRWFRCRRSPPSKTTTVPESLNHFQQLNSATIQGVAMPGVAQGDALAFLQNLVDAVAAAGLFDRLRRLEPAIHSGDQRLRRHIRLRADHHLPGACRPVRKLPRSGDHPGVGADVDRRRADLRQPRLRRHVAQHLHRSRDWSR